MNHGEATNWVPGLRMYNVSPEKKNGRESTVKWGKYGKLWKHMGKHGKIWETMGTYGKRTTFLVSFESLEEQTTWSHLDWGTLKVLPLTNKHHGSRLVLCGSVTGWSLMDVSNGHAILSGWNCSPADDQCHLPHPVPTKVFGNWGYKPYILLYSNVVM